jgi:hypothetical protein
MKIDYPKKWFLRSAEIEGTAEIGAGGAVWKSPIRRLADGWVESFAHGWSAESVRPEIPTELGQSRPGRLKTPLQMRFEHLELGLNDW